VFFCCGLKKSLKTKWLLAQVSDRAHMADELADTLKDIESLKEDLATLLK
jgi:hypothetical protein